MVQRNRWQQVQERLVARLRATLGAAYPPVGRRHDYVGLRVLAAVQEIESTAKLHLPTVPHTPAGSLSAGDVAALYRVLRTVYLTELVFDDVASARLWLSRPKVRLHGRVPLLMAGHTEHAQHLEQWLMEIDQGCHS